MERNNLSIAAMVILTVLAASVMVALPLIVGAIIGKLGLTLREAGWVAAADMFGASLAALGISSIIARGRWRQLLAIAIAILAVANLLSGLAESFTVLIAIRMIAGVGEGTILSIANASIGSTRMPDRGYGLATAGQLGFGAAALYILPHLLTAHGLRGVFLCLAIFAVACLPLVRYIPDAPVANSTPHLTIVGLPTGALIGLAGVFTYFVAQGGVWAYMERIGVANHFAQLDVGRALSISSIAGLAGAMLASWLGVRWGRVAPILIATGCSVASLVILNGDIDVVTFTLVASLFNFAWNFSVPYQFGTLAQLDASQRTVALGGAVVFAGLTMGPVLAGSVISAANYDNVNWMGAGFCVLSLVFFLRAMRPLK